MTTAIKTKTTCMSISYFGEKCSLKKPHTKRHTWDSDAYRRKRKKAILAVGGDTKNPGKKVRSKRTPAKSIPFSKAPAAPASVKASATSEVIDVVISFDTTGSMAPCLGQVRKNVADLTEQLFKDIPDLRIGIIAHGDYCDDPKLRGHYGRTGYVTKHLDLSRDVKQITNFVKTTGDTGGGDAPECYELVLHEARNQVSWETGRNKVLVMIGDATPHPPSYHLNTKNLDWKKECKALAEDGVTVTTVQCLRNAYTGADYFWKGMADITGGHHLVLDKFENIRDLIKAVCYKQQSPKALETFVRAVESGGRMTAGMSKVYSTLLGREIGSSGAEAEGAKHIDPSRFIVLKVNKDVDIRDFVKSKRKKFRKGCGYYQFTKSVKVQDHKEIILIEEKTGDFFGGKESRRILGFPDYGTIDVSPKSCAALQDGRYTAFVQSTSMNRKLLKGTKFLYENEHFDG